MPTVRDLLDAIERIAPVRFALPDDRVGLQIGDAGQNVKAGVVTLDWSDDLIGFAASKRAQAIVAHHPIIWEPISRVTSEDLRGRAIRRLVRELDAAYIACHTNWDAAPGGVSDTLAGLLGLKDARPFGVGAKCGYLKLVAFCPEESVQKLVDALSAAGAGVIGLYERCAYFSPGTGTFKGGEGSNPSVGAAGRIEEVPELRLEMRVPKDRAAAAEAALRRAHPYEEPTYDLYPLEVSAEMPLGRIGALPDPLSLAELATMVDSSLSTRSLAWGDPSARVSKVAVAGGAGDEFWREARRAGADAFVTGEVRQHAALEASQSGMGIVSAGHFATEHPGCAALRDRLAAELPGIEWHLFEPKPGRAGRPLA